MRIGRLFAVSMLSVTALAVVLGAEVLIPQYRTVVGKGEAIKAVEAFRTVLVVSQLIAGQRAPYLSPLFQESAATPAQLDAVTKAKQATDAAFGSARQAVGVLSDAAVLTEGLNQAAAGLAEVSAAADRSLALPMSGRDSAAVKGFLPGVAKALATIEPVL